MLVPVDPSVVQMKQFSDPLLNIAASSKTVAKLPIFRQRMENAGLLFKKIFDYVSLLLLGIIDLEL